MSYSRWIPKRKAWQRFTLLDLFLLQAGFGFGFSLACSLSPKDAPAAELATTGIVWGFVFAGPLVMMIQRIVRKRSQALSLGEWLWLSPTALFLLLCCSMEGPVAASVHWSRYLFLFWVFAQVMAMGVSVANLFSGLRGYRGCVPCLWTDQAGSGAAFLFGAWSICFVLPFLLLD
ncbi:MAG: hypothetical protein HQ582_29800 [Planctomycetes bacterium]|nr:hypothetical protein [Planctomycetota bacterium]